MDVSEWDSYLAVIEENSLGKYPDLLSLNGEQFRGSHLGKEAGKEP